MVSIRFDATKYIFAIFAFSMFANISNAKNPILERKALEDAEQYKQYLIHVQSAISYHSGQFSLLYDEEAYSSYALDILWMSAICKAFIEEGEDHHCKIYINNWGKLVRATGASRNDITKNKMNYYCDRIHSWLKSIDYPTPPDTGNKWIVELNSPISSNQLRCNVRPEFTQGYTKIDNIITGYYFSASLIHYTEFWMRTNRYLTEIEYTLK